MRTAWSPVPVPVSRSSCQTTRTGHHGTLTEPWAWLTRHPRFHLHFTPTGSSWINQVERWFGLLTDKLIRRGVHTSVQALENDIQDWIRTWNANPRPFTWVKTADDISTHSPTTSPRSSHKHQPTNNELRRTISDA